MRNNFENISIIVVSIQRDIELRSKSGEKRFRSLFNLRILINAEYDSSRMKSFKAFVKMSIIFY